MDMSQFDQREVARYQASARDDHSALMRFALHVEARDPSNLWPQMVYARSAASDDERAFYLERAVSVGLQRLQDQHDGQPGRMGAKEARLFRMAHYALAHVLAKQGDMERAAKVIGNLIELDPNDKMNALGMGVFMGVFPAQASQTAARMTM